MVKVSAERVAEMLAYDGEMPAYDNLGNHTATQNLNMGIYSINMGNGCRYWDMHTVSNTKFQMGDYNGCIGPPGFSNIITVVYAGTNYGNVGIGYSISNPSYQLQLSSNSAAKPGSSSWTVVSDRRLKKDVANYNEGLAQIRRINPVTYHYNGKLGMDTEEQFVGVIAQELKEVAPHMVSEFTYADEEADIEEKYLSVDMNALQYMEVNAIKELDQELQAQREINASLKRELDQLRETVNQLVAAQSDKSNVQPVKSLGHLDQNVPNPFNQATRIGYTLPEQIDQARIIVTNLNGQMVQVFDLEQGGHGHVTLQSSELSSGTYFYKLEINGQTVDARQLLLTD